MDSTLTLIILLIAGVVMYFLWNTLREYLGNEENLKRFKQEQSQAYALPQEPRLQDKVEQSEYGLLAGILGYVANADGEICELEKEMASSLLSDMAKEMKNLGSESEVYDILLAIFTSGNKNISSLAKGFVELTKGEYKKKLKVVEFCFALGYADGELNELTKEAIIDIGALLGIDNTDFNNLYDNFATSYEVQLTQEEAKEIFGSYDDLYSRYQELITQEKQNILDDKNLNKPLTPDALQNLRKIQKAYEILKG
ncbi:TerB family tellurite resistance protein [Helicobacter brantae]|uniref:Molecular chaperone DnaJ n=1 Tax=Helicobacter brantae TaxID=375927 RepID=A0A3D8J1A5_9HELI|nr:TerB family tellurite resistance protein [Helicobacter brantae]RDU70955.1 molecular chaperone DnaJ [Helicobacter brantae]